MTVDSTGVDFVLEKMMQLLNSDDRLILEAYEEKLIDKDQIQSLYEDMQFLRKFLTDSSKEKHNEEHEQFKVLISSKIRDVTTCEVDDFIDSLLLNTVLQKQHTRRRVFAADELRVVVGLSGEMVDLAEKINRFFKTITKERDFVRHLGMKVINLLSLFEDQLADD